MREIPVGSGDGLLGHSKGVVYKQGAYAVKHKQHVYVWHVQDSG